MASEEGSMDFGGEGDGVPLSSAASTVSNDMASERTNMSETEDSNMGQSSSETDSYSLGSVKNKDDASYKSSSSDMTQMAGPDSGITNPNFPQRPGIMWGKGHRLEAQDFQMNWYTSKIVEIDEDKKLVLIHFEGWNQRYDEWVHMDSERLRPLTRHSDRKGKGRHSRTVFKAGDQVLAKWTDCKMYLGKVDEVCGDGSYMVLFIDGFKKNVQPINIRPAPLEQKVKKFQINPPVLSPQDLQKIKNKPVDFKGAGSVSVSAHPTPSTSVEKAEEPQGKLPSQRHKPKLIVSGSLFSAMKPKVSPPPPVKRKRKPSAVKTPPPSTPASPPPAPPSATITTATAALPTEPAPEPIPPAQEGVQVPQQMQEVNVQEVTGVAGVGSAAVVGAEVGSQTILHPAPSAKKARKRPRSGSFPFDKRKRPKAAKVPRSPADPGVVKKAKSADTKPLESPGLPAPPPLLFPTLPVIAPKAFVVQEDHNPFKCDLCSKGFRKQRLLLDHMKHYHSPDVPPTTSTPSRKRSKTFSTCSTDSDLSVGSKSNSAKRRRHISEISVGSPDVAQKMFFDEESPGSTAGQGVPAESVGIEPPPPEGGEEDTSDEVVNCHCRVREEIGTMIQCDCCLCWQHTLCLGISDEQIESDDFLNTSYICYVCRNPKGIRANARYTYDMDWYRKGRLATFNFIPTQPSEEREREHLHTHELESELLTLQRVMHGLREQISLTEEREHPELRLWTPNSEPKFRTIGIVTSDDIHPPSTSSSKTPPPPDSAARGAQNSESAQNVGSAQKSECSQNSEPAQNSAESAQNNAQKSESAQSQNSESSTGAVAVSSESGSENAQTSEKASASAGSAFQNAGAASLGGSVPGSANTSQTNLAQTTTKTAENPLISDKPANSDEKSAAKPGDGDKSVENQPEKSTSEEKVTSAGENQGSNSNLQPPGVQSTTATASPKEAEKGEKGAAGSLLDSPGLQEGDGAVTTVRVDPFADCKLSVLGYVHTAHKDLTVQLDLLEQQITDVERQEFGTESSYSYSGVSNSSVSNLKHSLNRLARDLHKVKCIASYR